MAETCPTEGRRKKLKRSTPGFFKVRCKGAAANFVGAAKRDLISSIHLKPHFVGAAADFVGAICTHKTP